VSTLNRCTKREWGSACYRFRLSVRLEHSAPVSVLSILTTKQRWVAPHSTAPAQVIRGIELELKFRVKPAEGDDEPPNLAII